MTIADAPTQTNASHIVKEAVDVNVPISIAYNQWTMFEDFPEFMSTVKEITQQDDVNLHWKTSINGIDRDFNAIITQQIPDEIIAWESIDGIYNNGHVSFEAIDENNTRITAEIGWEPDGIVEKTGATLGVDDRQVKGDLGRFKKLVEADDYRPKQGWRDSIAVDSDDDDILFAT